MKVIIAGATGFIGSEILRLALQHPKISQIATLTRRSVSLSPSTPGAGKVTQAVCEDFLDYSDEVRKALGGSDVCFWLIALTPSTLKNHTWEETVRICQDYTTYGLKTISALSHDSQKLRFVYASGAKTVRDVKEKPWILGDFSVLRGEVENQVLRCASESGGEVEAYVVKIGLVERPETGWMMRGVKGVMMSVIGLPGIGLGECGRGMLRVGVEGWEGGDTLLNEDLDVLGRE